MKISQIRLALLTSLLVGSSSVSALEIEPGIGAGLLYTDNAALTADNEDDDLVVVGYLGLEINESSGPFRANVSTSLIYENYTSNTFGDQYNGNLAATAGWEMIRDRLDWNLRNHYSQQQRNSLDADTPDNNQNTNVFSFGPDIYFPLSARQRITVSPVFQDFYYEHDDSDNRRYSLRVDWLYKLYPTMDVGLDGGVTKVDYDDEDSNPDYIGTNLHAVVSGSRPRSEYTLNMGATSINRDKFDDQSGFTGDLTWLYHLTGHSSARLFAATSLSDSSRDLSNSQINPDNGDFSNEQISGDILRNNTVRLTFRRQDSTLNAEVWGEYRDLSYKESPDDRDVKEFGTRLDYRITPVITTGVIGRYNRTKETDTDRRDTEYLIGGNVSYRLTRKLITKFDLLYRDKDSTRSRDEYTEVSGFISLVYGFRDLSRPGRYSSGY